MPLLQHTIAMVCNEDTEGQNCERGSQLRPSVSSFAVDVDGFEVHAYKVDQLLTLSAQCDRNPIADGMP